MTTPETLAQADADLRRLDALAAAMALQAEELKEFDHLLHQLGKEAPCAKSSTNPSAA